MRREGSVKSPKATTLAISIPHTKQSGQTRLTGVAVEVEESRGGHGWLSGGECNWPPHKTLMTAFDRLSPLHHSIHSFSPSTLPLSSFPLYWPLIMDPIPWDQVKAGDLDALRVALFSSSTSRRLRALQELRDRSGKTWPTLPYNKLKLTYVIYRDRNLFRISAWNPSTTLPDLPSLRWPTFATSRSRMSPLPPPHAECRRPPQIPDRKAQDRGYQARPGFDIGLCIAGVVLHSFAAGQRRFGYALGDRAGSHCGGRQGFGKLFRPYSQDPSQAICSSSHQAGSTSHLLLPDMGRGCCAPVSHPTDHRCCGRQ